MFLLLPEVYEIKWALATCFTLQSSRNKGAEDSDSQMKPPGFCNSANWKGWMGKDDTNKRTDSPRGELASAFVEERAEELQTGCS